MEKSETTSLIKHQSSARVDSKPCLARRLPKAPNRGGQRKRPLSQTPLAQRPIHRVWSLGSDENEVHKH